MIQLCVTTLDKGITIICESCLNLNHFGSSECRLIMVRLSKYFIHKWIFSGSLQASKIIND
ncbi:hypothetical protein BMS3Bbin11_00202 [bacterium BMS3Bbin11]|nr:hypothetical protein BMS3Bbin11_00202 [bacterium BMS3Bbin11]